jgi:hypothetical protein
VLTELKDIHHQLREAIAELAAVVTRQQMDDAALTAARLKLTRLSRRRRSFIDCSVLPKLHDLATAEAALVADLRLESARLGVESSEHIGRWTMRSITADWAGYQRASAAMRASMLKRIEREAAILYPLLETRSASQQAA